MNTQTPHNLAGATRREQGTGSGSGGSYFGHEDAAHLLRLHQRYRATLRLLERNVGTDLSGARVLDVGCGDGEMLCQYMQWGVRADHLAGIDVRVDRIAQARDRMPAADLICGDGVELPWPDGRFDVVSAFTVFSSILDDATRRRVAGEMTRVLAPGGVVLWYDTVRENPHNPDVRAVSTREMRDLFPGLRVDLRKISFLPHIARRWPVAVLELFYSLLAAVPGCSSHALAALVKE